TIEAAQRKIEGLNFDTRKHVLEYDDVMNKQRTVIYKKRREILDKAASGQDLSEEVLGMVTKEIEEFVNFHFAQEEVDYKEIYQNAAAMMPLQPGDMKDTGD